MSNTQAPFGFLPEGTVAGAGPNFRLSARKIASSNATPIYTGDAVVPVTGSVTGYITQATAGTTALAGIFWGCKYLSISQGRVVWLPYWPGSDANGDVTAYVIDSPDTVFMVQAGASAVGMSAINMNIQLAVGTGNSTTGRSGMYVQNPASTATLPFTVVGNVTDPPGSNGTDNTSGYNYVLVTFNNEIFRAGLTSVS